MGLPCESFTLEHFMYPLKCLPSVFLSERKKLPGIKAVYLVVLGTGEVAYVGRTENLAQRWLTHSCYKQFKDDCEVKIAWVKMPESSSAMSLQALEEILIRCYRPKLNKNQLSLDQKCKLTIEVSESMRRRATIMALIQELSMSALINLALNRVFEDYEVNDVCQKNDPIIDKDRENLSTGWLEAQK